MRLIHSVYPACILAVGLVLTASTYAAQEFTFASVTFNQDNAPNQGLLLGNSVTLGGAVFTAGLPNSTTSGVLFPTATPTASGFDEQGSTGALGGLGTSGVRALNLPRNNDGANLRNGIELSFINALGIPNLGGNDLVIFESASTAGGVEGVMVRVLTNRFTDGWTQWHYWPAIGFQLTSGAEGVHSYVYDFSNMGVADNVIVEKIQLANLSPADRIDSIGLEISPGVFIGSGRVLFDGSTSVFPDAGPFDGDRVYATGALDPDPIFVCGLHNVLPFAAEFRATTPSGPNLSLTTSTPPWTSWILQSTDSLSTIEWLEVLQFTNMSDGTSVVTDSGQNGRPVPNTINQRFYRLISVGNNR